MITYILENSQEADLRLQDAILFRELTRQFGDKIVGIEMFREPVSDIIWGRDPHFQIPKRQALSSAAYLDPDLMEFMGSRVTGPQGAQKVIDRFSEIGQRAAIRNLARPNHSLRHMSVGDRFEQHRSAIAYPETENPLYLVHPAAFLYPRRFLIVNNEIVANTPMSYHETNPAILNHGSISQIHARDIHEPLIEGGREESNSFITAQQRRIVKEALSLTFMAHGAIDVGMQENGSYHGNMVITEIHADPPGGIDIFWADAAAYAKAIRENIALLEPSMAESDPEDAHP